MTTRKRSPSYPQYSLPQAADHIIAIMDYGIARCIDPETFTRKQIAEALGHTNVTSGTLNSKIASLKLYGLIVGRKDKFGLTELGLRLGWIEAATRLEERT